MIMRNYVKRLLLKEWSPIIGAFLAISTLSFIIYVTGFDFYRSENGFGFISLSIPVIIFAVIMPFFVFNYRFSKRGADVYYQLPFDERQFKNIRVIVGLLAVLVTVCAAFLVGYILFVVLYALAPDSRIVNYYFGESEQLYKLILYPSSLLLSLVSLLVFAAGQYFITCFAVSLTTRLTSAMFLVICLQLFLSSIAPLSLVFIDYYRPTSYIIELILFEFSPGIIGANALPSDICMGELFYGQTMYNNSLISQCITEYQTDNLPMIVTIVQIVVDLVIFGGCGFYTFYHKDPSGELNSCAGSTYKIVDYLIYGIFIAIAFGLHSMAHNNVFSYALIIVFLMGGFYLFMCIYLGTFKISKFHVIALCCSGAHMILFPLIASLMFAWNF